MWLEVLWELLVCATMIDYGGGLVPTCVVE